MDAGSSGTRVHVYRWINNARSRKNASPSELKSIPNVITKKHWTKKVHPGVSEFAEKPESIGEDHLKDLLDHALDVVPADQVADTPVFLLATAGMRLLPEHQQKTLLREICAYSRKHTDFHLPDCDLHVQVIKGETEGLYGWIASNFLIGGFDADAMQAHGHGNGHHTYGFLDMGGASAQIAFVPNATESKKHADDLTLLRMRTVGGQDAEYKVFTTTWLEFGVRETRRRYLELLEESMGSNVTELPDPCLPKGLKTTLSGDPLVDGDNKGKEDEQYLLGTGNFDECLKATYPLLRKDAPCENEPCLLNGIHVPAIDFDVNHFVGVSEYWYTTHSIFEMARKDSTYHFGSYRKLVEDFCTQDWTDIRSGLDKKKYGKKLDEDDAIEICFKSAWVIKVMHDGIGIPREPVGRNSSTVTTDELDPASQGFLDPFKAVNKIHGTEVSWTLGKMILFACSQIPPSTKPSSSSRPLPIGFGNNNPSGRPTNFQHAGGITATLPSDLKSSGQDDDVDWHSTLFDSDSPRRVPGLLLFVFIIALILFLLSGRDRRAALFRKLRFLPRGKRSGGGASGATSLGSKYFGNAATERLLESGAAADEFELTGEDFNSYYSDSNLVSPVDSAAASISSGLGMTSGWATPQLKVGAPGPLYSEDPAAMARVSALGQSGSSHYPGSVGLGLGLGSPTRLGRQGPVHRGNSASPAKFR